MPAIEWIRFGLVVFFILFGLSIFFLEIFGVYRFKFVLNRMQIAATGDTLGIGLCLVGLMIANGWNAATAKMALVIVFLWCASPVSSHVIARLEYTTDETLMENCRIVTIEEAEAEGETENGDI
ncbi:MAG: monovalent cation/H(+) antiporter subunit G [Lachnospiraceae bacterium]|nr:monovalent cation/H(+) antiporter subunit G [Lachnospiraceae bacterium]